MSNLLTIELYGKTESFRPRVHKGRVLYSMNEVWERFSFGNNDHPTQWHSEHVISLIKKGEMVLLDKDSTSEIAVYEWYAQEAVVYMFLAAVSVEFNDRVLKAFSALVDGSL